MNILKTVSFVVTRPSLGGCAKTLCHAYNERAENLPKANIIADAGKALSTTADYDAIVLIFSYADFDLGTAKSLMEKTTTKNIVCVAVDVPFNFSFVERLRARTQEYLPEGIMEMPSKQEALSDFTQLIFTRLCDKVTALHPTLPNSDTPAQDEEASDIDDSDVPSIQEVAVSPPDDSDSDTPGQDIVPLRSDLFAIAELLGFPLSDMCKLEAEKFSQETGIPQPYAESADETHTKVTQIMRNKLSDVIGGLIDGQRKQQGNIHFLPKHRLAALSFIALCDQYRKLNNPKEELMYSEVAFLKTPNEPLALLFALVDIMHLEYRTGKDGDDINAHYSKVMKEVSHIKDSQTKNFLIALAAHICLVVTMDEDKRSELRREFNKALGEISEEQKAFFETPATNAVGKARTALEGVM